MLSSFDGSLVGVVSSIACRFIGDGQLGIRGCETTGVRPVPPSMRLSKLKTPADGVVIETPISLTFLCRPSVGMDGIGRKFRRFGRVGMVGVCRVPLLMLLPPIGVVGVLRPDVGVVTPGIAPMIGLSDSIIRLAGVGPS